MTLPPIILLIEYYSPAFHLLGTLPVQKAVDKSDS